MAMTVDKVLDFIENWRTNRSISDNIELENEQITTFISELHMQVAQMDFSVPEGTTIIGYSGESNGVRAWQIAGRASAIAGDGAEYISDLPAGMLLGKGRNDLVKALESIFGNNENIIEKVISGGYDDGNNWVRLEGGKCGFGDLLSLDDFVSAKLMGETVGASNNLIVFTPEGIDPTKVFATTELERIFQNKTFEYINGIPKEALRVLYESGEVGKQSVYDILIKTSKEVVGDISELEGQANSLIDAFSGRGDLTVEGSPYVLYSCYNQTGNFVGVELVSKNKEEPLLSQGDSIAFRFTTQELLQYKDDVFNSDKVVNNFLDRQGVVGNPIKEQSIEGNKVFLMIKNLFGKMGFKTAKIKDTENKTAIGLQRTENGEDVVEDIDVGMERGMTVKDAVDKERLSMEDWKKAIGQEVTAVKQNVLQPNARSVANETER